MYGIQLSNVCFELVDIVIQVEYFGVNFIDTYYRSGLYKFKELPAILGSEAAGTIVSLPTDQDVLNNDTYKKQDFVVGGKVAVVRPPSLYISLLHTLKTSLFRPFLEYTRRTFLFPGNLSFLSPLRSRLK
jgi:hypothetical protein